MEFMLIAGGFEIFMGAWIIGIVLYADHAANS